MSEQGFDANTKFRYWFVEVAEEIKREAEKLSQRREAMMHAFIGRAQALRRKQKLSTEEAERQAAEEIREKNADYYEAEKKLELRRLEREQKLKHLSEEVKIFPEGEKLQTVDSCPSYVYSNQTDPLRCAEESLIPLRKYLEAEGVTTQIVIERDPPSKERFARPSGTARLAANCEPYMAEAAKRRMPWEFMSEAWGWSANPAVHIRNLPPELLDEHWRRTNPHKIEKG